jgi:hypothetical protein
MNDGIPIKNKDELNEYYKKVEEMYPKCPKCQGYTGFMWLWYDKDFLTPEVEAVCVGKIKKEPPDPNDGCGWKTIIYLN